MSQPGAAAATRATELASTAADPACDGSPPAISIRTGGVASTSITSAVTRPAARGATWPVKSAVNQGRPPASAT